MLILYSFPRMCGITPFLILIEIDWGFDGLLLFFYGINLVRLLTPHFLFSHKLSVLSNEFAVFVSLKMVYFFSGILRIGGEGRAVLTCHVLLIH